MTKFLSDLEVDLSKWLYNNNEPVYKNYGSLFPPLSKNKKVIVTFYLSLHLQFWHIFSELLLYKVAIAWYKIRIARYIFTIVRCFFSSELDIIPQICSEKRS